MSETFHRDQPEEETFDEPSARDGSAGRFFRSAFRQLGEVRDYISYYLSARVDKAKVSVRRLVIYAVLGMVGAIAGAALVASAVVLLCWGIAGAFGAIFQTWWLGYIIMGGLLMILLGLGVWLGLRRMSGQSLKRTAKKYDQRRQDQQTRHGHNVHERATGGH